MIIKPDKNVPMPLGRLHKGSRPSKYPWLTMEIGDSFPTQSGLGAAAGQVDRANMRYVPRKFISYIVIEDGVKVARVWRVE